MMIKSWFEICLGATVFNLMAKVHQGQFGN